MDKKTKKHTLLMLAAIADSAAIERYCSDVGKWDGGNPNKTLTWLRAVDQLLESVQMTVARFTTKDPLLIDPVLPKRNQLA